MTERRGSCKVWVGRHKGRRPIGTPRLYGRIILKWTFKK
jgi:hypothetical protein